MLFKLTMFRGYLRTRPGFSAQHGARAFDQIAGKAFGEASGNRFVANFLHHNQG
jgi:hypothetical protein